MSDCTAAPLGSPRASRVSPPPRERRTEAHAAVKQERPSDAIDGSHHAGNGASGGPVKHEDVGADSDDEPLGAAIAAAVAKVEKVAPAKAACSAAHAKAVASPRRTAAVARPAAGSDDDDKPLVALVKSAAGGDKAASAAPAARASPTAAAAAGGDGGDDSDGSDNAPLVALMRARGLPVKKLSTYASGVTEATRVKSDGSLKRALKAMKPERAAGGGGGGGGGGGRGTKRVRAAGDGAAKKGGGVKRAAYGSAFRLSSSRPLKEQAAERVLVRWHHVIAMPAATGDAPSSDYFELVGFPGVFVAIKNEDMGKIADLRPTEGRPSQQWLLGHSGAWLGANWQAAVKRQLVELEEVEGKRGSLQDALRGELKIADHFDVAKADRGL